MADMLTSSNPKDAEEGRVCKRVASALETTWLQTRGHKLLTEDTWQKAQVKSRYCSVYVLIQHST